LSTALDVKVKPVDDIIAERTRLACCCPFRRHRAKSSPEEVREVIGGFIVLNFDGRIATKREQDLLAGCVANGDILDNLVTALEQLRLYPVDHIVRAITLVSEVAARIAGSALIREDIDEAQDQNVYRTILAEVAKTLLIRSLALQTATS
jgi:hypothetical protein